MNTIRFFTITILILATIAIGSTEATDYIISFTDGSNRVGYFVLKANGASIKASPPVFTTGTAAIGTTTPYKLNNDVLIHHTFRFGTSGAPTYGVAVFDFPNGKLKQKLSFQNFNIYDFYPLRVYGAQNGSTPRTMYAKTQNDISSALLKADGTPAGGKKPIFNNAGCVRYRVWCRCIQRWKLGCSSHVYIARLYSFKPVPDQAYFKRRRNRISWPL